ncbi:hypothetical protein [Pseudobacteroides cellulosolvens]|uniref:Uncharacterized protein n=2 Tax=Pseudobacteroides cellulosolvens TaxID=35825 RepID=A0A0L6JUQ8_9FIRM|nr:hypothetical protein [Pseudobacteroides cellulosolvens]KNY29162.1 hypothetical protein Bccel_4436 [Pseudobacteroides cellulosolvens ATCC 35603 = DSM 2933]
MKRIKFKIKIILIIICVVYLTQYVCAQMIIDYSDNRYYIDDPSINVVSGESEIDKSEKILKDYDDTDGTYKIVLRFYKWWHATCQHVGHDEWIRYKVFKDGSPPEQVATMITFNQMPLSTYDANNHNWGEWVEIERLEATNKEDGYIKYKRECKYQKGWWATLGAHEPDYKTEVIPKLSIKNPIVTPTPTPTLKPKPSAAPIGKIKFDPPSCEWRNLPQNVRVYVDGNKTTTQYDSDIRQYRYTVTVTDPVTLETTTETRTGSTYWRVEQDWTIDKLLVTGPLLDGDKIIDAGGTVTMTKEGIGQLNACVYSWKPGTAKWVSGDPPRGSWID